jgi:hypothetical protein
LNEGHSGTIFPSIAIASGASLLAFGTAKLLDLFPDVAYMGNCFPEAFWGCWLALPGPGDRSWAQGPGGLLAGVQKTGSGTQRQHKTSRVLLPIRAQLQQLGRGSSRSTKRLHGQRAQSLFTKTSFSTELTFSVAAWSLEGRDIKNKQMWRTRFSPYKCTCKCPTQFDLPPSAKLKYSLFKPDFMCYASTTTTASDPAPRFQC